MTYRILVPLDGSELAEEAVAFALSVAERVAARGGMSAELQLMRVRASGGHGPNGGRTVAAQEPRRVEDEYVARVRERAAMTTDAEVSCQVRTGEPVATICARALKWRADIVVMTTHGRTGLSRAWLGSVADGVVRESHVPVLLHRSGQTAGVPRHYLVPLDGSPLAEQVLDRLLPFLRDAASVVTLVRVEAPVPLLTVESTEPYAFLSPAVIDEVLTQQVMDQARQYLTRMARWLHERTPARVETAAVLDPHVAHAILQVAAAAHADGIAMTTRGRGASRLVLGSIADKVLRGTTLPLLLFRPRAARRAATTTARRGGRRRALAPA